MNQALRLLWSRISRIGLKEHEDITMLREVILLNRLLVLLLLVILVYIPAEIYFNGFKLLPAVIIMMVLALFSLVLHHFRLFRLAHYYLFFITSAFVMTMGLMVGKEVQNYIMFYPVVLLATLLFKTNVERVGGLILTVSLFLIQQKLFTLIEPQIYIEASIKNAFSVIFFLMGLTITFLIGFYFVRINREYEAIIITQRDKIETKNKEITDSINYARRIQNAILPPASRISSLLQESFIIYKPKDIVAGDFYWLESVDDMVMVAAADCTGHGVPGAMVSVVCNNALNRSVKEFGLTDPGKILNKTREIVLEEFQKSGEKVNDGMDISLACWDKTKSMMKWAGANNPLWLVRDKKLIEYKGDKQPIGDYPKPVDFSTHHIELKTGDVMYLFTDGYYDQFGGEKGKKFKASKLKDLLTTVSHEPAEIQKDLITECFETWKGPLEQVDDVCLIGVKVCF